MSLLLTRMFVYRRYLLKAGGIDADQNIKDLDSIDFRNAFEQSGPVDTDINVGALYGSGAYRYLTLGVYSPTFALGKTKMSRQ
jgi:hypothetical protein